MNINEQKNILSYKSKPKNKKKLENKSFDFNNIDILDLTNNSKIKKNIFDINNNSYLFNNKLNNTNKLYKDKILDEMKYINNKFYFERIKEKNKNDLGLKSKNKSLEYKRKILLNSTYDKKLVEINNNKKRYNMKMENYSYIKPYLGNLNTELTPALKNQLNEELKYLQKQYYLMDKINNKEQHKQIKRPKKYGFFDYAENNTIYNHPQLYYINTNKKRILPKIDFSIKMTCLTGSIPDKNELLYKNDLINLNDFTKMKKSKRPIFK